MGVNSHETENQKIAVIRVGKTYKLALYPQPMASHSETHILEGPIVRTLFILGWPVMVTSLLETMYTLVDTFWLGKLGPSEATSAVAALQISWPIISFLMAVAFGFGIAGIALISQYTGAQKKEEANLSAGQVLFMSLLLGSMVAVTGFLFSPTIVSLLSLEKGIGELATIYMRIIFLGMPFMFVSMTFGFILRAYGDMVTPMKVEGVTVLLNVILDPIFIFGLYGLPQMGVFGAALATILCQGISSVVGLYVLFSGKSGIDLRLKDLKPVKWRIFQILRIGIPASVGFSGTAFGFVILMYIIARLPNQGVVLAAYGIGDRLINLMFIAINGLGAGVATVLGQCLGADNIKRAEEVARKGLLLMFSILVVASLVLFFVRGLAIRVFISDEAVVREGSDFIMFFLFGVPFYGVFSAVNACFMGSGHNVPSMVTELARLWGLRIPLAYVCGFVLGWNAPGVWFGMGLSNVLGAVLALGLFKTGIWKKKVIK